MLRDGALLLLAAGGARLTVNGVAAERQTPLATGDALALPAAIQCWLWWKAPPRLRPAPMRPRRREFTVFTMTFLDVMASGFGAIIMVYLLVSHRVDENIRHKSASLTAEVTMLEEDIVDGRINRCREICGASESRAQGTASISSVTISPAVRCRKS